MYYIFVGRVTVKGGTPFMGTLEHAKLKAVELASVNPGKTINVCMHNLAGYTRVYQCRFTEDGSQLTVY